LRSARQAWHPPLLAGLVLAGPVAVAVAAFGIGQARSPALELASCGLADFMCGEIGGEQPDPQGRLGFALESDDAKSEYLLIVPGGPGIRGTDTLADRLAALPAAIVARYRIVVVDPPASDPSLACWEAEAAWMAARARQLPAEGTLAAAEAFVVACAAEVGGWSDPAAFSAEGTASLLEELRAALGIERWTILAESYGSLAALRYATEHPDRVSALVLDAPVASTDVAAGELPGAVTDAIGHWETACRATRCTGGITEAPAGVYRAALGALWAGAVEVALDASTMRVRAGDLEHLALLAQLRPELRPAFLRLLVTGLAGDWRPLAVALADAYGLDPATLRPAFVPTEPALGAYYAGRCADSGWRHLASADRLARYTAAATDRTGEPAAGVLAGELPCAFWPTIGSAPLGLDLDRLGDVPVLVIHAPEDGLVSPSLLADLQSVPGAVTIRADGGGHLNLGKNTCVDQAVADWLADASGLSPPLVCPPGLQVSP